MRSLLAAFAIAAALSFVLLQPALAQQTPQKTTVRENPSNTLKEDAERGWFFYERDKEPEPEEPIVEEPPRATPTPSPTEQERCTSKETWTVDCGFVDPGKDFEFQAKQRDELMRAMAMNQNDPQAVENFQYYMKWLVERSVEVANLWKYNLVQNPELDATVKAPVSTFGLKLMTQVRSSSEDAILTALKEEGAFLIYFSRHDCNFCHAMTSTLANLAKDTGLDMWNVALDDTCMPKFEDRCRRGAEAVRVAQALRVTIVPTLFLYVPGSKPDQDTWLRIATGVTDSQTMKGRVVSFFTAYRTALLKGVANGTKNRPSVDFSQSRPTGIASGVAPSDSVQLPTEEQIKELFSK